MINKTLILNILILIGYKLTNRQLVKDMFNKGMDQFVPFVATIVGILFTDLLVGVFIGLAVSIVLVLKNYYKLQMFQLERIEKKGNHYKLQFLNYTTFLYKASLEKTLRQIEPNSSIELDFSLMTMIDHEVIDMLEDFYIFANDNNIKVTRTPSPENIKSMKIA